MRFPKLNVRPQSREFIQEFGGLDRRARISENCFAEMQNLTGDQYPALSPRKKRGIIGTDKKYNAILAAGEHLAYVEGNTLHWGDVEMELVEGEDVKRQLVMMGAYIVVFPDAMYLNTADTSDWGSFISKDVFSFDAEKKHTFGLFSVKRNGDTIESLSSVNAANTISVKITTEGKTDIRIYLKKATFSASALLVGDVITLEGIPNPNHSFFSSFSLAISSDYWEIVENNPNSLYAQIKCVNTDTFSFSGTITVINQQNNFTVTHSIWKLNNFQTITMDSGYELCYDDSTKATSLYWRNPETGDSTEKEGALKIQTDVMNSLCYGDYENIKMIFDVNSFFGISFLSGASTKTVKGRLDDGGLWIEESLFGLAPFAAVCSAIGYTATLEVESMFPKMDYVIESQNRLWGCRYGANVNGKLVNEIYASALGDFRKWYTFAGVSTDSYAASVGLPGSFTGAVNYRGYPLFFKENVMFKVYGDYPENYQIVSDPSMGVQKGCDKSLFVLSNVLYYRSPDGLFAYNGSTNERIDAVLGNEHYTDVACCGTGSKLWVSMTGEREDHSGLYVCDTEKGLWHKEDGVIAQHMVRFENDVYIADDTDRLFTVNGSVGDVEKDEVRFFAETGVIGYSTPDSKYVSRFALRVAVPHDGSLQIFVEYDSANVWEFKGSIEGNGMGTFTVPVVPRRCDHFRIRLAGKGDCRIFGFSKVLEEGGSV